MSNRIQCSRCERISRATKAKAWNVTVSRGIPVGYLCPDCQTPEENAEAEINLATTRYAVDSFGRMIGSPRIGETA